MAFLIKEDPELEGSFEVVIQTERPLSLDATVVLKYRQRKCAAVASQGSGPNQILADKFLINHLGIPKSSQVCFTKEEYIAFIKQFQNAKGTFESLARTRGDSIYINLDKISDDQKKDIGNVAFKEILNHSIVQVEIDPIELKHAEHVQIHIPAEWLGNEGGEKKVKDKLFDKPLSEGMEVYIYTMEGPKPIIISGITPSPFAMFSKDTKVEFKSLEKAKEESTGLTWDNFVGPAKEKIRELVEYPMLLPEVVAYMGITPPKGILLYGPPGTGKTLIARILCNELNASFHSIQGPEIVSSYIGESEKKLREIFEKASNEATLEKPSIILIDEVDSIAPKRGDGHGGSESKLVATLLTEMNGLRETKGVIVIGTTNRPDAIDLALRRPERFEYEIYVGIPDIQGREELLRKDTEKMPLAEEAIQNLQALAQKTHGFSGADIAFLCREAGRNAFRRIYLRKDEVGFEEDLKEKPGMLDMVEAAITKPLEHATDETAPPSLKDSALILDAEIAMSDFEEALLVVSPSGMREVLIQVPRDVTWEKIGGLEEVKEIIDENIIKGIKNPGIFKDMGIKPARGILLHGPPGTGKTLIAKAIANECEANFIAIKGPELRSKWFGESEEKIRFIFDTARRHAPCVIFLDEVDALTPARGTDISGSTDSIVNQFLSEMDGVQSAEGVFIIGATNRVELIDEALKRPGRFNYEVFVPLPDIKARRKIFDINLKKEVTGTDVDFRAIVKKTEGFSGAEIAEVCRLAGLKALRDVKFERANFIKMEHLSDAINDIIEKKAEATDVWRKREATYVYDEEETIPKKKPRIIFKKPEELSPVYYLVLIALLISLGVSLGVIGYILFPKDFFKWGIPLGVMIFSYSAWILWKYVIPKSKRQRKKVGYGEMEEK